jgi:hypothetical protein
LLAAVAAEVAAFNIQALVCLKYLVAVAVLVATVLRADFL